MALHFDYNYNEEATDCDYTAALNTIYMPPHSLSSSFSLLSLTHCTPQIKADIELSIARPSASATASRPDSIAVLFSRSET